MTDWQPIETAPKDGTKFDLWVVTKYSYPSMTCYDCAGRIVNCSWDGTQWVRYIAEGDFCGDKDEIESSKAAYEVVATHWMPLPAPP